ncbi:MAG: glutathione S-transferase family protein [Myxococcota bacterium]|nr:glutathione S-transferase family protein [Myxococcota bacterium]
MAELDRIYGAELSPYSVKVRSYYRYKGLPHRWIMRNSDTMAEYQKYARVPIIPLVVTGDDRAMQDSTPIIEALEAANPEPSIHPTDPVAAFVSALIEEFGDEWGNKWMFHLRWAREVDQVASSRRIASSMLAKANEEQVEAMAEQIRERMLGRVWFVGSSEQTGPQIEASFREGLAELDAHLATRPYLFGARPAFGDFGLWGQVYEAWTDPTGAALVETVPNVLDWVHRMTWPRAEGEFEAWSSLEETLMPFLQNQIGKRFLPWTLANERAVAEGSEEFSVELGGQTWTQKPQKYHAKSLASLREKYAAAQSDSLDPILESAGCLAGLQA